MRLRKKIWLNETPQNRTRPLVSHIPAALFFFFREKYPVFPFFSCQNEKGVLYCCHNIVIFCNTLTMSASGVKKRDYE